MIGDEAGEPQPAFDDVELVRDDLLPGAYRIKSASPVWQGFDLAAAEVFLSDSGRAAFMAEYQHRFDVERTEFVLPHYRDEVHVITRSQFEAVYGTREVPARWGSRWFNDWAATKTAKHANVAGRVTISGQNTRVPGVVFLADCMSFAAGTHADDVAVRVLKTLSPRGAPLGGGSYRPWDSVFGDSFARTNVSEYAGSLTQMLEMARDSRAHVLRPIVERVLREQKYPQFRGSHEQNNNVLRVYRQVYGLPFKATNPGADGGVELLNDVMRVDRTRPHQFKEDGRGEDGLYRLGLTRFFILVEDEDMAPPPKGANPRELHDAQLARYQLRRWRHLPVSDTATGEVERGPEKRNDDFGNGLMFCVHDGLPPAARLEQWEIDEETLGPALRWESIEKMTDKAAQAQACTNRQLALGHIRYSREAGRSPHFGVTRVRFTKDWPRASQEFDEWGDRVR